MCLGLVAAAALQLASAGDPAAFSLLEDYTGEKFFQGFDFFDAHDPTDGASCCMLLRCQPRALCWQSLPLASLRWRADSGCVRTTGCVEFLSEKDARAAGLTGVNAAGQVFMRTDNTSWNPRDSGNRTARRSVRVSSKRAYDPKTLSGGTNETGKIMFVLDVAHMPTGCAVWPSWWMNSVLGSWPEQGEVDLIEVPITMH